MRRFFFLVSIVCVTQTGFAQSYAISELSPVAGMSFFSLGGASRSGPSLAIQYSPNRFMVPSLEFSGGVALRLTEGQVPTSQRMISPISGTGFPSPLPNGGEYFATQPPSKSVLSFGYAFLGGDAKFFLASGDVRPYLSAGVHVLMYSLYSTLTVAAAPDLRAGLDLQFSNGFSAFGEVRHLIGFPGVLSPADRAFDNATVLALGFTFLPSFN